MTLIARFILTALMLAPLCSAGPQEPQSPAGPLTPFDFHSNFWINLHHFLYEQALQESAHPRGSSRPEPLPSTDQAKWDRATAFYKETVISHDLLFDPSMRNLDTALASAENSRSLTSVPLDAALRTRLEAVAQIYRDHWWQSHNQVNRFWIAAVTPLMRQFGSSLVIQISHAYETNWPTDPVRVDVTEYANWAGAYTFGTKHVHTILSSYNPSNQGFAALEVLFHEATHGFVDENEGRLAERIAAHSKLDKLPIPDGLWHAVIFFTAGELVRRDLITVGVQNYQPYAEKNGLYARAGWSRYESALQLFWIPHVNGQLSLDTAISKVISALAVADRHNN